MSLDAEQMPTGMRQYAPFPVDLKALVDACAYRPGWAIALMDLERDPADTHGHSAGGLTLRITTFGLDSYNPANDHYRVHHYFVVPAATYNRASWLRWLFECYLLVERHEAMEFFKLRRYDDIESPVDRPFAPTHGPGDDPYIVHEVATERQAATNFRGVVLPAIPVQGDYLPRKTTDALRDRVKGG